MKAYDLVELAGRNLREAVLRNSLTTMGIAVGVASLVAMLSLGAGLQQMFGNKLGKSGLFDNIIVASKQDFSSMEDRRLGPKTKPSELRVLDDKARAELEKIPGVKEVYPEIRMNVETRYTAPGKEEQAHFTTLASLPVSSNASEAFEDLQGSFFSGANVNECIILGEFARELLELPEDTRALRNQKIEPADAKRIIGTDLILRYGEKVPNAAAEQKPASADAPVALGFSVVRKELKLRIIGVVNTEPYGGVRAASRGRVFIPVALAETLNAVQPTDLRTMMRPSTGKTYLTLIVRADRASLVPTLQDAIRKMGFSTYSLQDASQALTRAFAIVDIFLGIFGSLALAVASLGIMNTLVMAIMERRREIGIMKALGASDFDVKKLFFFEAGAMGLLGGVLGVSLGWIIGKVINFGTNVYLERQDMPPEHLWYLPLWLVLGALSFSIVMSLVSGLYPASRAAKLDPVQALRHD
jgi:ABC-type antimicrobial peptide transport system permease subunit